MPVDFRWMCFVRLMTSDKLDNALSSIDPTLLYMKNDDNSIASENILTS
jgi:hypothetical protein